MNGANDTTSLQRCWMEWAILAHSITTALQSPASQHHQEHLRSSCIPCKKLLGCSWWCWWPARRAAGLRPLGLKPS